MFESTAWLRQKEGVCMKISWEIFRSAPGNAGCPDSRVYLELNEIPHADCDRFAPCCLLFGLTAIDGPDAGRGS
jgi:hypothetical protein